jgi:septal ring factor EnvC (AmiA/AmiB activator)
VTTGMIINLKCFTIMSKNKKELSQVKARQTKLGKKSNDELIQIVLKKDKIERNLNNQIKNLKGEVNHLSTRVKNFDSDMEGTNQALESYKDKVKALQEKNDVVSIESKDNFCKYLEENKRAIALNNKLDIWKTITYLMAAIAVVAIIVAIL